MTRRYSDPVDVRRRDEDPVEFLWRGRLYVVRDVLAHWLEAGAWWDGAAARALLGTDGSPGRGAGSAPAPPAALPAAPPGASPGASPAAPPGVDGEQEVWRVEASPGRAAGSGVFDLCFDWSAGAWTLRRAMD